MDNRKSQSYNSDVTAAKTRGEMNWIPLNLIFKTKRLLHKQIQKTKTKGIFSII